MNSIVYTVGAVVMLLSIAATLYLVTYAIFGSIKRRRNRRV